MLLDPKPVKTMELTEEQARNLLKRKLSCIECPRYKTCRNEAGPGFICEYVRIIESGTADEVFATVRELAGGESE